MRPSYPAVRHQDQSDRDATPTCCAFGIPVPAPSHCRRSLQPHSAQSQTRTPSRGGSRSWGALRPAPRAVDNDIWLHLFDRTSHLPSLIQSIACLSSLGRLVQWLLASSRIRCVSGPRIATFSMSACARGPERRATCACVGFSAAGWGVPRLAAVRGAVAAYGRPVESLRVGGLAAARPTRDPVGNAHQKPRFARVPHRMVV